MPLTVCPSLGASEAVNGKWGPGLVYFSRGSQGRCEIIGESPLQPLLMVLLSGGGHYGRLLHVSGMLFCYQHIVLLKSVEVHLLKALFPAFT